MAVIGILVVLLRFGLLNVMLSLPVEKDDLRREGETSCLRGETSDIILLNKS